MKSASIIIYSPRQGEGRIIGEALRSANIEVSYTQSLEQTLEMLALKEPAIVISTVAAPFINGSNTLRDLKAKCSAECKFYVVGWHYSERMVVSLLESGIDQYMTFPISLERLRLKVAAEVEQQRSATRWGTHSGTHTGLHSGAREGAREALRSATHSCSQSGSHYSASSSVSHAQGARHDSLGITQSE